MGELQKRFPSRCIGAAIQRLLRPGRQCPKTFEVMVSCGLALRLHEAQASWQSKPHGGPLASTWAIESWAAPCHQKGVPLHPSAATSSPRASCYKESRACCHGMQAAVACACRSQSTAPACAHRRPGRAWLLLRRARPPQPRQLSTPRICRPARHHTPGRAPPPGRSCRGAAGDACRLSAGGAHAHPSRRHRIHSPLPRRPRRGARRPPQGRKGEQGAHTRTCRPW